MNADRRRSGTQYDFTAKAKQQVSIIGVYLRVSVADPSYLMLNKTNRHAGPGAG